MNRNVFSWRGLVAAVVVAAGVAVMWGFVFVWLGSLATAMFGPGDRVTEDLQVALDGTPVISVESRVDYGSVALSRRTVEGKPWPNDYELWLGGAYLEGKFQPPGLVQPPIPWTRYRGRIGGGTDGKRPPADWYIVRPPGDDGHLYLAGFDVMSKRAIGYIGQHGFRPSPPPVKDRFALAQGDLDQIYNSITSTQYIRYGWMVDYHSLSNQARLAQWLIFLDDGERLWKIDLRERTAQAVLETPGALSVDQFRTREEIVLGPAADDAAGQPPGSSDGPSTADAQTEAAAVTVPVAVSTSPSEPPRMLSVIAVRMADRIVLYDEPTGRRWEFKLPADAPGGRVNAYWIEPDRLLLEYWAGHWSGGSVSQLLWTTPEGTVERQERLELQGWVPASPRSEAWKFCGAAPVPIAWLVGMLVGAPLVLIQDHRAATFAAGLQWTFAVGWPMLVVVVLAAALLTWAAVRLQRKYFRPRTGVWAVFVLLFGPAGLIAYWLEHRRPKLEPCGECGRVIPRDREACAACDAEFPAPPPVGTEIFA